MSIIFMAMENLGQTKKKKKGFRLGIPVLYFIVSNFPKIMVNTSFKFSGISRYNCNLSPVLIKTVKVCQFVYYTNVKVNSAPSCRHTKPISTLLSFSFIHFSPTGYTVGGSLYHAYIYTFSFLQRVSNSYH